MSIKMEADVVVVAAGMSGLSAAVQAQELLNERGGGKVIAFADNRAADSPGNGTDSSCVLFHL